MLDILGLYKVLKTRDLTSEESGWVTAWLKKYPYFAYAHFLKARETGDEAALFQAAVYAPVRPLLRRFMEDTAPIAPVLPVSGDQAVLAGGLHPAVRLPLTLHLPAVAAGHTPPAWGVHIPTRLDGRGYAFLNHWLGVEIQTYRDMPAVIRSQITRHKPLAAEVPATPAPQAQDDQATLIERFLAAPPRFQPRRIPPAAPAEPLPQVEASLSTDDEWVTETLALLHLRQHNREEALRIYRKLRLLFPEKSTYFDARIQKIVEES